MTSLPAALRKGGQNNSQLWRENLWFVSLTTAAQAMTGRFLLLLASLPTKPVFYRRKCWQCLNLEMSCNFHLYAALDAQQTYLVEVKRANWGKWAKLGKKGQKRRKRHVDAQSARSGHNIAGAWLGCLVVAYFQILWYRPGPIHFWE